MSDYDSGDELFYGVDANELLSSAPSQPRKRKREEDDDAIQARGELNSDKRQRADNGLIDDDDDGHGDDGDDDDDGDDASDVELDPSIMELASRILKENFGYQTFRHEQEAAIKRILDGKNALVIFPTGAGKSLCYQVCNPAVHRALDGKRGP
jgi:superfamily II DNA helicase RecQ